ncbi:McrB family protein [Dictyobacter formicarum]|uniref:ATPase dynein-related AAA domain-containing protein n=1 Tax=Dictyobacter formicarum TaxID=2778368 RepID=A0ABQ3V8R3_9CHLR|nr:hypothetical protein [Dictyobacter formicarum]GHO82282.1 hypothetical protein KSZ_02880 [Dictyobacter formicarum]
MNYYLFSVENRAITSRHLYPLNEELTLSFPGDLFFPFEIDDHIFLLHKMEKCILPYEFIVVKMNRDHGTFVVKVSVIYQQAIPLPAINLLLSEDQTKGDFTQISKREVKAMTSLMRILSSTTILSPEQAASTSTASRQIDQAEEEDIIFDEREVLDYVKDYIRNKGYYFEDEALYNYHICLKTRPFVILAGLSGTGKSKLAQLYTEALGQQQHFKRLSVRPNWNDDRYLLGYLNTVTGEYITEPAVEFIMDAMKDQRNLYSLCLDEMNLAHVEYYFSQFLSAMEEDQPKDRCISLLSKRAQAQLEREKKENIFTEIYLPENLLFTGTINIDETTQPISDKVIDRANTIEFFNVDLEKIPEPRETSDPLRVSAKAWQSYQVKKPDTSYQSTIIEINKILKQADIGIGYRILHEIGLYMANNNGLLDTQVAFDLQVKQRILPRVRGTENIEKMLNELLAFSKSNKLTRTERRLTEMKNRLKRDGYTSFWR